MKTVTILGKEELEIQERPLPEPAEGQVRLQMAYAGICGSDLHYYFNGANGEFVVEEPLIPGHEVSGVVDLDPSGVLAPGTKVTVHPATFGPKMDAIPDSRHLWPGGSYLGSASTHPHTQGGMTQYMLVNADMVRPLPAGLSLKAAALAEPFGVALHAANQAGGEAVIKGAKVLVTGSGPIGLLQIAAALAQGAASVDASDVLDGPLSRAKDLGADQVFKAGVDEIPREAYDVVFECSGSAPGINSAWAAARRGGIVVQVGMIAAGPQPLNYAQCISKELTLRGTFRFNNEIDDAVRILAERPEFEQVVTHVLGVEDAVDAFGVAKDSQASGKVLVQLNELD